MGAYGDFWKKMNAALRGVRTDGWQNVLTGLGVSGFDKRLGAQLSVSRHLLQVETEILWDEDAICARIIEKLPAEMTREGCEVVCKEDPEAGTSMDAWLAARKISGHEQKVLEFDRAHGGGALLLGVDDGSASWAAPLNEKNIKSFNWVRAYTPDELEPVAWQIQPNAEDYGEPTLYKLRPHNNPPGVMLAPGKDLVHASRLILFTGIRTGNKRRTPGHPWGASVLQRCIQVIRDFQAAWSGAFVLTQDFATPVYQLKGLDQLIAGNDTQKLKDRLTAMETARGIIRAMLIGEGESYERKATPLSGLAELLDVSFTRLSLEADMPMSILMGKAPAGLSGDAAGSSDMQQFFDRVGAQQKSKHAPMHKRIVALAYAAKNGPTGGKVPAEWDLEYLPLWQLTDKEWADVRKVTSEANKIDIESGVLAPEEVRKSCYGGAKYSMKITLDEAAFEEMKAAEEEEVEAMKEAMLAKPKTSPPKPTT